MSFKIKNNLRIKETTKILQAEALRAIKIGAETLLEKSKEHVPHRKGMLENSGATSSDATDPDNPVATVFYDTPYAERLHEHPEYNFKGKGRGKWLQTARDENGKIILDEMARIMREALK